MLPILVRSLSVTYPYPATIPYMPAVARNVTAKEDCVYTRKIGERVRPLSTEYNMKKKAAFSNDNRLRVAERNITRPTSPKISPIRRNGVLSKKRRNGGFEIVITETSAVVKSAAAIQR